MDTAPIVDDILEHHGIKGMKWGVRKAVDLGFGLDTAGPRPKSKVGPQKVVVSDKRKKIKTSGGAGHPAHPDAVRVRKTGQVAKKSGVKALSDKELQDYARRIQLEHNVKRLQYHESSVPVKFVKTILGQSGKKTSEMVADEGTRAVKRTIIKKFTRTAAVAAVA